MQITFVSNYINHHQIPFCNQMCRLLEGGGAFTFIQTEEMEAGRVQMGWGGEDRPSYVKCFYEEEEICRRLIADSDVVIFGGVDDESYIEERLQAGKPVLRYSERLYKTGQWKAISPRGLKKKYLDHTRYRKSPVYLLCAGAYVASDYHIVRAYPGKMYCWGYFPEAKQYDVEKLFLEKHRIPHLLWAGRMIDWKHPELALETAKYLKGKGHSFHMDIIGGGDLYPHVEKLLAEYELEDFVTLRGYQSPGEVRRYMERADIFLFTSDRQEGWGAVANEAMNSGCALVANHMIGAIPYLVQNGKNGLIYEDGKKEQLFALTEKLVEDGEFCRRLGRKAYETIVTTWNAENAAVRLLELIRTRVLHEEPKELHTPAATVSDGLEPCMPAPVLSERAARRLACLSPESR